MSTPEHLLKIKKEIAESFPDFEANATKAWQEIIAEIAQTATKVSAAGSDYIPQVKFSELDKLSPEQIAEIKRKGTIIIRDIVEDAEAAKWKTSLEEFVKANPKRIEGFPEEDLQFFQLYNHPCDQLSFPIEVGPNLKLKLARTPNVLATSIWLNNLYSTPPDANLEGVDLSTPLSYADRFRIRHPGGNFQALPPYVDGGTIERWEDPAFHSCFNDILSGNWRSHDPYELGGRLNARTSIYHRGSQTSIFRSFQGWLAMSKTGPKRGTLRVYPDVLLSNAYLILRPFFRSTVGPDAKDYLKPESWKFDISYPEFPGLQAKESGFSSPKPTPEEHPHMLLDKMIVSIPEVSPGDAVFWHCDVVHSVESEHSGDEDSAVMYIPAVPTTPLNQAYIEKQREAFLKGVAPPDYQKVKVDEADLVGIGKADDILSPLGRRAMGFPVSVV
ncbi:hypothetical protein AAF712_009916 [Marasmius tenuissimus]|uniref:DUF1479-domain-containing protein n=1 Tax=Marasmius tenuissimus TaxID=585030 RepID=A0ABR2ZP88_9AGAR